ncbi:MAG: rhomboid family intramembrane serine protease [Actinobacteria bacterium]|nr:rhomboid family intramembrane serine protease [Actinomycetota bacterium]
MLLPIRTNMPLRSTPVVNYLLLVVNIAVFLVTRHGLAAGRLDNYVLQASYPQLHQFLTHAFLHANFAHLAGNMLFLYIFGNNINDRLGNVGYLAFYLAAAFFAGLGHVYMEQSPAVGASGAIAAVTGIYLILLARTEITLFFWFFFLGTFELSALIWILLSFGKNLFNSLQPGDFQIAYSAHIAGYLFGFGIGLVLLFIGLVRRSRYDLFSFFISPSRPLPVPSSGPDFTDSQRQVLSLRQQTLDSLAAHDMDRSVELYNQLRRNDSSQVLPMQAQLDLANQFMAQGNYQQAAEAYELFLKTYPTSSQTAQVQLMLGLICTRYLDQPGRARALLSQALDGLPEDSSAHQMCRAELARISPGGASP